MNQMNVKLDIPKIRRLILSLLYWVCLHSLLICNFYITKKHTKISSADQGIGSHYYFLYSRSEERVVGALGF